MLTRKQLDLLKYIHTAVQKDGVSPSFDEMKEALDLRSKSGIHRLITALEERGFIRRLAHRARAIEILKYPDGFEGVPADTSADIIKPVFGVKPDPVQTLPSLDAQAVPIYGKIAAGVPIEAIQHDGAFVAAPAAMLSAAGEHYALEVKGDSMIDAGIHEGDIVVVKKQDAADGVEGRRPQQRPLDDVGGVAVEEGKPRAGYGGGHHGGRDQQGEGGGGGKQGGVGDEVCNG